MPYTTALNNFNTKYRVQIDKNVISASVTQMLNTGTTNADRDALIRAFIKENYSDLASQSQTSKVMSQILRAPNVPDTTAKGMLDEYVELINQIAKASSDRLVREAEQAAKDAEKELEEAKVAEAQALEEYNKLRTTENKNAYERAKEKVRIKTNKENYKFEPYEQTNPYFGLSTKDAKTLLTDQLNTFSYAKARRLQISNHRARNPMFKSEIDALSGVTDYRTASPDQKKALQEVYATKKLMEARLNRTGFKAWVWRLFHGSEVDAMTNYIKDATERLAAAHFSDNEDAIREADEMETRGFGYNANEINEAVEEYKVTLAKGDERELREAAEKE